MRPVVTQRYPNIVTAALLKQSAIIKIAFQDSLMSKTKFLFHFFTKGLKYEFYLLDGLIQLDITTCSTSFTLA